MKKRKSKKKSKSKLSLPTIKIIDSGSNPRRPIMVATPTLGIIRMEWALARFGQAIPTNWSCSSAVLTNGVIPKGYLVADGQNIAVKSFLEDGHEWLFFVEDDVILPLNTFMHLNKNYIFKKEVPIVSGLYYLKARPSEPVLYRGRGNGAFYDFKIGDLVWADGVPTGCLLIHRSILELMWNESEEYIAFATSRNPVKTRKVFETPNSVYFNPEAHTFNLGGGTSDLNWCSRIIEENVLKRAGWPKIARKKYPFLCDTNIFCKHINLETGEQYP